MADYNYIKYKAFYNVWQGMKRRCLSSYASGYERYGGRGIKIDSRWFSFKNFFEDMHPSYKKGLTLDRIDNDENYCKENCNWVTRERQANNRHNNKYLIWRNETKTIADWARVLNIKFSTLKQRFYVYKWDIDRCFGGQIG